MFQFSNLHDLRPLSCLKTHGLEEEVPALLDQLGPVAHVGQDEGQGHQGRGPEGKVPHARGEPAAVVVDDAADDGTDLKRCRCSVSRFGGVILQKCFLLYLIPPPQCR